jgi:pyridoxal phosphate enzyme (YggS family)
VAVTKTVGPAAIQAAYDAGQRLFGENRVQELTGKAPVLPADCEWHLVGHLQRNKVRPALQAAGWIHAADSAQLIDRIGRLAAELEARPAILLEVNMSAEETKFGVPPAAAGRLLEAALACPAVACRGLMTLAPFGAPEAVLRRVFGGLRELRDTLQQAYAVPLPDLSMGMSADFEVAVEEGATLVRVGTAVFGPR